MKKEEVKTVEARVVLVSKVVSVDDEKVVGLDSLWEVKGLRDKMG